LRAFFDTNILVYAIGEDQAKADLAWDRLLAGGVISVQVLNEIVSVSRRKMKRSWDQIDQTLLDIRSLDLEVVPLTLTAHDAAVIISRDHHLRIYDAMIVASAQEAGCDVLWSEDMADGHRLGALTIRNPFKISDA